MTDENMTLHVLTPAWAIWDPYLGSNNGEPYIVPIAAWRLVGDNAWNHRARPMYLNNGELVDALGGPCPAATTMIGPRIVTTDPHTEKYWLDTKAMLEYYEEQSDKLRQAIEREMTDGSDG